MARKKIGTYGLLELAKDVLNETGNTPLAAQEIWDKATNEQKKKLTSQAQDPAQSIYSLIYQDIKNHSDSEFVGVGRTPIKWQLKRFEDDKNKEAVLENEESNEPEDIDNGNTPSRRDERNLHRILVSYVGYDSYFSSCYCKTIMHERSDRKKKGLNHWVHPDVVGVSYPFNEIGGYDKRTIKFMKELEHTECRLFSFEMKWYVTASDLREYFFEAVSNSSWAHEGYLVAIDYEPGIEDEMKMLNESFGIGFIKLNVEDYTKSVRLLAARRKEELDWNMVNRLLSENPDFARLIEIIESDMGGSSVRNKQDFDEPFKSIEECANYCKSKNIC